MASTDTQPTVSKKLILNAFVESCSGHQSPGLWAHPDDKSWNFNDITHWVELAKLLEKGKFHGMFIADVLVSHPFPATNNLPNSHRARTTCIKALAIQTLQLCQGRSGQSMSLSP